MLVNYYANLKHIYSPVFRVSDSRTFNDFKDQSALDLLAWLCGDQLLCSLGMHEPSDQLDVLIYI